MGLVVIIVAAVVLVSLVGGCIARRHKQQGTARIVENGHSSPQLAPSEYSLSLSLSLTPLIFLCIFHLQV